MADFLSVFMDTAQRDAAVQSLSGSPLLLEAFRREAEERISQPLVSLADLPAPHAPNLVYCSQAPYWWDRGDGVYERRDGQANPDRFVSHFAAMERMGETALLLAQAGFVFDERRFTERAEAWLRAWFIQEATRMQPHLELAQSVPGQSRGRFYGIIDSLSLLKAVHACTFFRVDDGLNHALQAWFSGYLDWLTGSEFGRLARACGNNHAVWWHVQAAAYAAFTGKDEVLDETLAHFADSVLPSQLDERAAFPEELSRAEGLFYSLFVLDAWAILGEIAITHGRGRLVWDAKNTSGRGFADAISFLRPYLNQDQAWPFRGKHRPFATQLCLQLGARHFTLPGISARQTRLEGNRAQPLENSRLGVLCLLPGYANFL